MNSWVEISEKEKKVLVEAIKHQRCSIPQFFTLESDKNDVGGNFAEMSKEDILEAAKDSVRFCSL